VLVLQHHEDARQEVPDEVLRAETDGHADDTGGGEDGSEVDAQFAEDQHERQAEHHETGQRLQQRTYGLGSLPTPLQHHGTEDFGGPFLQGPQYRGYLGRALGRRPGESVDQFPDEESDEDRAEEDQQDSERPCYEPVGRRRKPRVTRDLPDLLTPRSDVLGAFGWFAPGGFAEELFHRWFALLPGVPWHVAGVR